MKHRTRIAQASIFSGITVLRNPIVSSQIAQRPLTAYEKLWIYLRNAQRSRIETCVRVGLTVLVTSFFAVAIASYGWLPTVIVTFFFSLICYVVVMCVNITWRALGFGTDETVLISRAQTFLEENALTDAELETMRLRAEISSSVGPVRSLIPLLLLPIGISFMGNLQHVPIMGFFVVLILLIVLVVPIVMDMYKATIDGIIRHALAQYWCDQHQRIVADTEPDKELLQALIHAPYGK